MRCTKCGSNVGSGMRFCTNCGYAVDADDAVVRIVEDEPLINNVHSLSSRKLLRADLIIPVLKKNKRKLLALFSVMLAAVMLIISLNIIKKYSKKDCQQDGEFILMTKLESGQKNLYLGLPGKEEIKLASDVAEAYSYSYIKTGKNSRKYIYFDNNESLYEVDEDGNREKIAEEVRDYYVSTSPDFKKYLYISGSRNELYLRETGKGTVKVDDDVEMYHFIQDNKTIIYKKLNKDVLIRNNSGRIDKLGEDVDYFLTNSNQTKMIYYKSDGSVYSKNLNTGKEIVLSKGPEASVRAISFDKEGNLLYIKEQTLYYQRNGEEEPLKIEGDIRDFRHVVDGIVYLDLRGDWHFLKISSMESEILPEIQEPRDFQYKDGCIIYNDISGTLYRIKVGTKGKEKIHENVVNLHSYIEENDIYFVSSVEKQILYKLQKDGSAVKIQEGASNIRFLEDRRVCYLTKDKDLYVGNKKYGGVKGYIVGGNNVCYLNSSDELYLIEGKSKPQKLCNNIEEYSEIFYGDNYIWSIKDYLKSQQENY